MTNTTNPAAPQTDAASATAQLTPGARAILASPYFAQLRQRRGRLALMLTVAMLVIYYGFILLVAFSPSTLAIKVSSGAISLGLPLGLGVIVSAIALTGVYVWRANRDFDVLTEQALRGAP